MCLYLHTKFQVSNIILASFRQRGIILLPTPTSKRNPKKPTQIRFNTISINCSSISNRCSYSKKILGSGMTALIISNEEMIDIMKMNKFLKYAVLVIYGVSETIENEVKEQKRRFLGMLLGTLGASLLGNMFGSKVFKCSKIPRRGAIRAREEVIRSGQDL